MTVNTAVMSTEIDSAPAPETLAEFIDLTGGTGTWVRASGKPHVRISQWKAQGRARGIELLLKSASDAFGVPYRDEWIIADEQIIPRIAWPAEAGRLAS